MKGLRDLFPDIQNEGLIELIEGMLNYNPSFRITAAEALKHEVFDSLRVKQREIPAKRQIDLPIYADGAYDYEECVSVAAGTKDFQRMILEEVQSMKSAARVAGITRLADNRSRAFSPVA